MANNSNNNVPVLSMTNSTSNLPGRNPFFPSSTSNDRKFQAPPQPLGNGNDAASRSNLAVSNNEVDFASVTSSEVDNTSSRSDLGIDEDKKAKSVNTLTMNKAVPESLNASGSSSTTTAAKPPGLFDSVPAITQLLSSPWTVSKNENKFVFPSSSSSAIKSEDSSIKLTKSFNLEKKTSFSKGTEDLKLSQSFAAPKPSVQKKQSQPDVSREHSPSKQSNKSGNSSKSTNSLQVRTLKAKEPKNANSDTDSEEMVQMDVSSPQQAHP